jgi:hypothetical protein
VNTLSKVDSDFQNWALVDFKVQKEDWVYYELSDGARLKFKLVARMVFRSKTLADDKGEVVYSVDIEPVMALALFPESQRRSPSIGNITYRRLEKMTPEELVTFEKMKQSQEACSVYLLDDGATMTSTFKLTSVSRTKLRDRNGAPVYQTKWNVSSNFAHGPPSPQSKS